MAMVVDAFVGGALTKISALIQERASMMLEVRGELKVMLRMLERLKIFLDDAEIEGTRLLEGHRLPNTTSTTSVNNCFPLISCFTGTKLRYAIAEQIKELNGRLKEIQDNKPIKLEVGTSTVRNRNVDFHQINHMMIKSDYVGSEIENATENLVGSLIRESYDTRKCGVWGIVGMGGIGKSTLASKIYNHAMITEHFQIRIWVCVSQSFSATELLKEIIRGTGRVCGEASSKVELPSMLVSSLSSKFFLVLDDVWKADVWEDLLRSPLELCGATSGRVLVTTRDIGIARNMMATVHNVQKMNNYDGWVLLQKKVFGEYGNEEEKLGLKDIGMKIIGKCDGLPLAIKAIAGVLRSNEQSRTEWEKFLRSHAWSIAQLPEELRGALYLSYEDLPSPLKQCFLFCSLYPEDAVIISGDLIHYWVAEGFISVDGDTQMEEIAEGYYNELIRRNLLQPVIEVIGNRHCKMHDLLRSLAHFLIADESFCIVNEEAATTLMNASTLRNIRRLSVAIMTGTATLMSEKSRCLRTLIFFDNPPADLRMLLGNNDQVKFLGRLRVLDLAHSKIESLPDSIGKLVHLRYLSLNYTSIRALPESIGNLVYLQTLKLSLCKKLHNLPHGITRLCNLRCLTLHETPLEYLPKGLDRMKQLNRLSGFSVSDVYSMGQASNMEELQFLTQLRMLSMVNLERATAGTSALTNKQFLKELWLSFSLACDNGFQYEETEVKRAEKVIEELFPPPNLKLFNIEGFPGHGYPRWMSYYTCFPCLENLFLINCRSCTQLPLLGQLPQLRILKIVGADAIVTVGPELLFGSDTYERQGAFPKLEYLFFQQMHNWEKWWLGSYFRSSTKLMPLLKQLVLDDCPKLRSLPVGEEQATRLERLFITGAHQIREVKNLAFLDMLRVENCPDLRRIHRLPVLGDLTIVSCPQLTHVSKLDSLHILRLRYDDSSVERLPNWVVELAEGPHPPTLRMSGPQFILQCSIVQFQRCREGGVDWPIIKQFLRVHITTNDGRESLVYTNRGSKQS